jgi:hypothetical protein
MNLMFEDSERPMLGTKNTNMYMTVFYQKNSNYKFFYCFKKNLDQSGSELNPVPVFSKRLDQDPKQWMAQRTISSAGAILPESNLWLLCMAALLHPSQ